MSVKELTPLTPSCTRALVDKLYQKRKGAALEVEKIVKELVSNDEQNDIIQILKMLGGDLVYSQNPNSRKGGLIGLAAVAIGLGKTSCQYINELILPAMAAVHDSDRSVQYQACEALFNIIKVVRSSVLPFFNDIFDVLNKLVVHPDSEVKSGAGLLDRLLKDIVAESASFDLVAFLPLLRERIYTKNVVARQFILSWIEILDAVPEINMVVFLPEILDGLLLILGEGNPEVCKLCQNVLAEFLESIKCQKNAVNFKSLANVLVIHSQSGQLLAQATALAWLREFATLCPATMVPHMAGMLNAVLPCLSYTDQEHRKVKSAGEALNSRLYELVESADDEDRSSPPVDSGQESASDEDMVDTQGKESSSSQMEVRSVLQVLLQHLGHRNVQTRLAVLKWIDHLLLKAPNQTFRCVPVFFHQLLDTLCDTFESIVLLDLKILCEISSSPIGREMDVNLFGRLGQQPQTVPPGVQHIVATSQGLNPFFPHLMVELLSLFRRQSQLFEDRGAFIVRHLSVLLGAEAVFSSLAEVILQEKDVTFATSVARALSTILLTSSELFELRCHLRDLKTKESRSLFCRLYRCWCHSPVATLSLCYLTHNYSHACLLMQHFGDIEITVQVLREIDELVQLIESPVFSYLRLHLLDAERNSDLIRSLYGLLMLVPQSEAFRVLKCRLECIPSFSYCSSLECRNSRAEKSDSSTQESDIPFQELLEHFISVQTTHRQTKHRDLARRLSQQWTGP